MESIKLEQYLLDKDDSELKSIFFQTDFILRNRNIIKAWDYDIYNIDKLFDELMTFESTLNSKMSYSCWWSVRTKNILLSKNIKTLRELHKYSSADILKWKGAGEKVVLEISEKFSEFLLDWDYE